ncbi:HEPN domain-containing protein [Sphingobacterium wenxiniae]|uniref:HEPN domain-containing protein n=1 Tax=Sphingobacterium wenxiniae TaxID=683125 RepID=A0A1I6RZW6_9SPHI|nr:HEPN domain-containing protein [Sphingobacterium wenxiniae]SFS70140.1 HEPN domain-containing protein [Sphingobacterium wenxiniae]
MNTLPSDTLTLLTEQLPVDEIFQWTYQRNGKKYSMLHIHLQPEPGIRFNDARETCENILANEKNLHFTLYFTKEIQKEIELGAARFYLICQPSNRIYQNPNPKSAIQLPEISAADLSLQATAYINKEVEKIQSFINGYSFYLVNNNCAHAAFMLHQALELSCRTAQKLLSGDEKKSHSIKSNIAFLKVFDSKLGKLGSTTTRGAALAKLDESYIAFRYEQDFCMGRAPLECCYQITCKALEWITKYSTIFLQEIQNKLNRQPIAHQESKTPLNYNHIDMENNTHTNNNPRELILNALQALGKVHAVYCFAYKNALQQITNNLLYIHHAQLDVEHYYLFVIMGEAPKSLMDFQNSIQQLLPSSIHITLIAENTDRVQKHLKEGDLFRSNLLRSAECWYQEHHFDLENIQTAALDKPQMKWLWEKRYNNALQLAPPWTGEAERPLNEATCYTLSLAIEQICLGLIQHFMHYIPDSTLLNYLMNLCDIICPEGTAVFLRDSQEEENTFNVLIKAQQKFRHSPNFSINRKHIPILYQQTQSFIKHANEIITKDLQDEEKEEASLCREETA